jgi:hypothetical protein
MRYTRWNSLWCLAEQKDTLPHAVLLNSHAKLPLLWRALGNNLKDKALLGVTRSKDKIAEVAKDLGFEGLMADGKSKIIYWRPGEKEAKVYDGMWCLMRAFWMMNKRLMALTGTMRFEPLTNFFEDIAKEPLAKGKEEL